jgi:uncharacterized protein YndB with AHSA1/START domain
MSPTPVVHDTFTLKRTVSAPPPRVFEALANPEIKAKWFAGGPSWSQKKRSMDFRVGGREEVSGVHANGITSLFEALYLDIVPAARIVYVYEMTVGGRKISSSLATFQLFAEGNGKTRVVLTEQGAYFDDPDMKEYAPNGQAASRLEGTKALMDQLARLLEA